MRISQALSFVVVFLWTSLAAAKETPVCADVLKGRAALNLQVKATTFSPTPRQLKVATYNVAGLMSRKTYDGVLRLPSAHTQGLADTILGADPDVLWLEEVESQRALERFARGPLAGKYRALMLPGNDPFGSGIGVLVRQDLPFDLELRSHRTLEHQYQGHVEPLFVRDLPVLTLFVAGHSEPLLAIGGVHQKSRRSRFRDRESFKKRSAEVLGALEVRSRYRSLYGRRFPFLLMGDFNTDVATASEMQPLYRGGFVDAFDLMNEPLLPEDRVTHSMHANGESAYSQLDGILVSGRLARPGVVGWAGVASYFDKNGRPKPRPTTRQERNANPSDHFLVSAVIDITALLQ